MEDCDKICADTHKRRMHLTDKHIFPKASRISDLLNSIYILLRWDSAELRLQHSQHGHRQEELDAAIEASEFSLQHKISLKVP